MKFNIKLNLNLKLKGYVAITSVFILMFVIIIIGTTAALTSIGESQVSLSEQQSTTVLSDAESCVDETLLKLNTSGVLPGSVTMPGYSCTVTLESQTGSQWTYKVAYTSGLYTKTIRVIASRSDKVYILSWEEI